MNDQYKFGKVLFQIISGRRPITERDMESVREINEMARVELMKGVREDISCQLTGLDSNTLRSHL